MKKIIYFAMCLATFSMVACATISKEYTANNLPLLNDNSGNCQQIGDGIEGSTIDAKDMLSAYGTETARLQQLAKQKAVEMGSSHIKFAKEESKLTTVGSAVSRQISVAWKAYKCK